MEFHLSFARNEEEYVDEYEKVDEVELLKSFAVVNWICFVISSIIIGVNVWVLRFYPSELIVLDVNLTKDRAPFWLFIGSLSAVISILGVLRHHNKITYRISTAHLFLLILALVSLSGSLVWYSDENHGESISARRVRRFHLLYGATNTSQGIVYTEAMDFVQRRYQCCGMEIGPEDHFAKRISGNMGQMLPDSCCQTDFEKVCQRARPNFGIADERIFNRPCEGIMPSMYLNYFANVALILILMFCAMIIAMSAYLFQAKLLNLGPMLSFIIGITQVSVAGLELNYLMRMSLSSADDKWLLAFTCLFLAGGILMLLVSSGNVIGVLINRNRAIVSGMMSASTHLVNAFNGILLFACLYTLASNLLNQTRHDVISELSPTDEKKYQLLLVLTYCLSITSVSFVCASRVSLAGMRMLLAQ